MTTKHISLIKIWNWAGTNQALQILPKSQSAQSVSLQKKKKMKCMGEVIN